MSEKIAPREAFGKTLVELGEKNPDIVAAYLYAYP